MAIALTGFTPAQAQTWTHYSEWMAYARRNMVYNGSSYTSGTSNADWWRYDDGLMYESILDTYEYYKTRGGVHGSDLLSGVERYLNYSITGTSESPNITNCTGKNGEKELDDMRPGRLVWKYCYTYNHTENSKIDVYKAACQAIMNAPAFQDSYRVGYSDGHHDFPWQHKATYTQQVWLDGIFMGIPYWTLAGPQIGSTNKSGWGTNATKFFDDAVRQMQVTDSTTYVSSTGLWCHAWDYTKTKKWADCDNFSLTKPTPTVSPETKSGSNTGRSLHTWGRALGWYAMAIMETMDNITAADANYAKLNDMKALFKKVMDAVLTYKDATSGVWYCVLDVGDNTAADSPYNQDKYPSGNDNKPKKNNYLEATCSSMFAYCLLRGVAQGYLPASYLDDAKNAYTSVVSKFITHDSSNNLYLNSCMKVGGLDNSGRDGSFAYYMSEDTISNDSKGVGPFIWASLEAEKIGYNMATNSFDPIDENTIVTFAWSKASDEITQGASYTSPTFTARSYGNDTPLTNSSEIVFESSDTDVATVAADGTVTPVGIGTATITAALKTGSTYTWSGTTPSYTITVNAPDVTAPTLSSSTPTSGAINVSTSGTIVLTFSEEVTCTTNATLTPAGGSAINLTPTVSGTTVIYSYSGLSNEIEYTFNLAANSVADTSGNNYANAITFSFTTKAAATETTLTFFDGTNSSATVPGALNDVTTGFSCTPYNLKSSIQNCEYQLGSTQYYKSIKMGGGAASGPKNLISFTVPEGYTCDMYMVYLETSTGAAIGVGTSIEKPTTSNSSSFDVWHTAIAETNTLYSTTQSDLAAGTYYICPSGDVVQVAHLEFTLTPTSPTPSTFTLTNTVNTSGYGTVSPTTVANIPSGTATSSSTNTYTVNGTTVTATPTDATAEYTYAFSGWSNLPSTVTTNATVTANFTRTAKEYTLAWNSNGGSALSGDYTSGTVDFGTAITAPNDPTRDGYTFNGWNSANDGSGNAPTGNMPAANTTYYAQWQAVSSVAPSISTQPVGATYTQGDTPTALSVTATGNPVPTYQWYSNTTNSTDGATAIDGATSTSYPPSTTTVGTTYYYCIASNSMADTRSDIVAVTVNAIAVPTFTYDSTVRADQASIAGAHTGDVVTINAETGKYIYADWSGSTSQTKDYVFTDGKSRAQTTYQTEISAGGTRVIYAVAGVNDDGTGASSDLTYIQFTGVTPQNPTFSVAEGSVAKNTSLTLTAGYNEDKIYYTYTTDGSEPADPTTSSTLYSSALDIFTADNTTYKIKAVAFDKDGNNPSSVILKTYTTPAAPALAISTQPVGNTYTQNTAASAMTVAATGGTPDYTYQWYSNTTNSTEGASTIANATNASYTPSTATVGTTYYYCVVTDDASATVTSNIVAVTVNAGGGGEPETYQLVNDPEGTPTLTDDFLIGNLTLNQNTTATIDGIAFKKAVKFGSTLTSISGKTAGDANICYDVKTTNTKFTVYVANKTGTLYFSTIAEGEATTTTENKIVSTNPQKLEFTLNSTTNTRVGFSISDTNMYIYQILAEESGTPHKQAGEAGYVLDFNKVRYGGLKTSSGDGKTGKIDNIEIVSYSSHKHTASTPLQLEKNSANTYIKFTTGASACKLKATFSAGTLIANTSQSTTGGTALTSATAQELATNTTYYIINTHTNNRAQITKIEFEAAEAPTTYNVSKGTETNGTFTISPTSAAAGATITVTTSPVSGYSVGAVTATKAGSGTVEVTNTATNTYTFTMPADDVTVNVTFEEEVAQVATPTISPVDGTVFAGTTQSVSMTCGTAGATIYYTLDGTTPTSSSTRYTAAFTIYGTKTVKAIAIKEGMTNSTIASATITNTCQNEYNAGGEASSITLDSSNDDQDNTIGSHTTTWGTVSLNNPDSKKGGVSGDYKKFGATTWTLTLPTGYSASSITFTGKSNATSGEKTTITNVDGETLGTAYSFDYSNASEDSKFTYNFATPQNEITFVVTGYQLLLKISLTAPASDGTLLLKEAATDYTPVAATGVDVTLTRTLQANKWNALCLPFDVTPAMFSSATNGATTNLETLKGVNNGIFTFAEVTEVAAGTPFIAKPTSNIVNPTFSDVEIKAVSPGSTTKDGYKFQGTYTKVTLDPAVNLFISMSQQKMVKPTGSNILQGLRAYFTIPEGEGARVGLDFNAFIEEITTDINQLNMEHLPLYSDDNTPLYNLSGQRVSKSYKGIVIVNGKKVLRK